MILSRSLAFQQHSTFPFSFLEILEAVVVCSFAFSHIVLILSLEPIACFMPVVLAMAIHLPSNKVSVVVRPIWILHESLPFNLIDMVFQPDLTLVHNSAAKCYLYIEGLFFEKFLLGFQAERFYKSYATFFTLSDQSHFVIEFRVTSNPVSLQNSILFAQVKFARASSLIIHYVSPIRRFVRPDYSAFALGHSLSNLAFIIKLIRDIDNAFAGLRLSLLPVALLVLSFLRDEFGA